MGGIVRSDQEGDTRPGRTTKTHGVATKYEGVKSRPCVGTVSVKIPNAEPTAS